MSTMRDAVAALVAAVLIFAALSLLTTLHVYRKRQRQAREDELAHGRRIIVELPTDPDLTLFTEDDERFHYGARSIEKRDVQAVTLLINGAPIASAARPGVAASPVQARDDSFDGIARDRWDVAIDTRSGTILVECGSVRERVSQELARSVFAAVKASLHASDATIRAQQHPHDD